MELPKNVKDISGLRVGRLVVKEFSHLQNHKAIWLCDCDCGNKAIPKYGFTLTSKNPTQSCGCLQREFSKENIKKVSKCNIGKRKGNKYTKYEDYYEGFDCNGNVFLIDISDYEKVSKNTWCINDNGYFSTIINDKKVYLHRFVLNCSYNDEVIVDHINGVRSDCRKKNLRKADRFVNAWNAETINKYGAKNIRKRGRKYEVRGVYKGITYYIGSFENLDKAIKARIDFENEHYPEYRRDDIGR